MGIIILNLLTFIQKLQNIPIYTHNDDKKRKTTTNHNMDINNETQICDKKTQRFSWNLKLNNNLLH
jgi:hypothetical protein